MGARRTHENFAARLAPSAAPVAAQRPSARRSRARTARTSVPKKPRAAARSVCTTPACARRFGSKATSAAARIPARSPAHDRTAQPVTTTRRKNSAVTGARATANNVSGRRGELKLKGRGCSAEPMENGTSIFGARPPAARIAKPDKSFTSGGCSRFA